MTPSFEQCVLHCQCTCQVGSALFQDMSEVCLLCAAFRKRDGLENDIALLQLSCYSAQGVESDIACCTLLHPVAFAEIAVQEILHA